MGDREYALSLSQGRLVLTVPEVLTTNDLEDIHDFLAIAERSMNWTRRVEPAPRDSGAGEG